MSLEDIAIRTWLDVPKDEKATVSWCRTKLTDRSISFKSKDKKHDLEMCLFNAPLEQSREGDDDSDDEEWNEKAN